MVELEENMAIVLIAKNHLCIQGDNGAYPCDVAYVDESFGIAWCEGLGRTIRKTVL